MRCGGSCTWGEPSEQHRQGSRERQDGASFGTLLHGGHRRRHPRPLGSPPRRPITRDAYQHDGAGYGPRAAAAAAATSNGRKGQGRSRCSSRRLRSYSNGRGAAGGAAVKRGGSCAKGRRRARGGAADGAAGVEIARGG
uniref:Uncharacterized protein n=1 Tax=Arundo donax TaxID=35708 RepID=A0A0A9CP80_ARUDO